MKATEFFIRTPKIVRTPFLIFAGVFLSFLVVSGCARNSQALDSSLGAYTDHLERNIPRRMERYGIPGVGMALIQGGRTVWTGAFGYADLEENRPMSTDTVCRAESISKSVTAWGIMRLFEKGRVELRDPLERYLTGFELPDTRYDTIGVTVERLLSHTAGMPLGPIGPGVEYPPGGALPSAREFLKGKTDPVQSPGEGFIYSNIGYNLLELLVEEITGTDFAVYMREEVLLPLGMEDADYAWRDDFTGRVPLGHENDGTPVDPYVYPVKGSGGLFATVDDIARFAAAGMTGEYFVSTAAGVLSEESIRAIHTPRVEIPGIFGVVADSYGFGHFIETLPDGRRALWHGGQGHGWMTHFHIVPEAGTGIVILTNSQRSWPFMAEVLDEWAGWNGFSSVRMGNITTANRIVTVLFGVILLAALYLIVRLILGLIGGGRRFAPLAKAGRIGRLTAAAAGLTVIAVVVWRATLPYNFETSIFPTIIGWGTTVLVFFSIVLIVSALFPRDSNRLTRKRVRQ
ncbi:MAG: serine hydrolase domain-containing protein [Spirochaetia bacterium]